MWFVWKMCVCRTKKPIVEIFRFSDFQKKEDRKNRKKKIVRAWVQFWWQVRVTLLGQFEQKIIKLWSFLFFSGVVKTYFWLSFLLIEINWEYSRYLWYNPRTKINSNMSSRRKAIYQAPISNTRKFVDLLQ